MSYNRYFVSNLKVATVNCIYAVIFRPQDSRRLLEFLQHVSPVKYKTSQKLIGHDINNSTYNYKTTFHVELPTVCKDDLICLSKKAAKKLGNMGNYDDFFRFSRLKMLFMKSEALIL